MSFEAPKNPQAWQNHYTEKQAHLDSMRRIQRSLLIQWGIPLLAYIFIIPFTFAWVINQFNPENLIWSIALLVLVYFAPIAFMLMGKMTIARAAAKFFTDVHHLEEDTATGLVKLRLTGMPILPPPLSQWFKFPEVKVKDGMLEPPEHWSTVVGGPVKIKLEKGQAAYLEHEGRFSRVVGQGDAFLHWEERIAATVDLGPKTFEIKTSAWTRDGIPIAVSARGEFFLGDATRTGMNENVLIPFDAENVKKAVEHCLKNGKDVNQWLQFAEGSAKGTINNFIISRYLDQIFVQDEGSDALLTHENMHEIAATINEATQKYGAYLSYFQVMEITPPQQVIELRKKTLKTEQENTALVTQSAVLAHQIRTREKLRAEMQRDLIMTIASGLNRTDGANFPEQLMLSISGFLDQNITDPTVRSNLHKETLETLEKLQEAIKFPARHSEEDDEN
jgi:hypothetical protein